MGLGRGCGVGGYPTQLEVLPEERTELWLDSGCKRAGAIQPGWGWVHPFPLALGKQGGKKSRQIGCGALQADTLPACVHGPGPRQTGLYALVPLPAPCCPLCLRGSSAREGEAAKCPDQNYSGVLFVRLMVLEEVGFRRQ